MTNEKFHTLANSLCGPLDIHPESINGQKVIAALLAAYNAGLEDAAKVCDETSADNREIGAPAEQYCALALAKRIRALVKS